MVKPLRSIPMVLSIRSPLNWYNNGLSRPASHHPSVGPRSEVGDHYRQPLAGRSSDRGRTERELRDWFELAVLTSPSLRSWLFGVERLAQLVVF